MTGTFDNWAKSVRLDKTGSVHEKTVALPKTDEKILYKVRTAFAPLSPARLWARSAFAPWR